MALLPHDAARAQVRRPRFTSNPFALGVASGFPVQDSVVIWTRLAPDPLAPSGGGEYALQDGFGWTNGVYLDLTLP